MATTRARISSHSAIPTTGLNPAAKGRRADDSGRNEEPITIPLLTKSPTNEITPVSADREVVREQDKLDDLKRHLREALAALRDRKDVDRRAAALLAGTPVPPAAVVADVDALERAIERQQAAVGIARDRALARKVEQLRPRYRASV